MSEMQTDWVAFISRYRQLAGTFFSPHVQPKYDEEGSELPMAMSISHLTEMFKNMGLIPPSTRRDKPRFMNPEQQKGFDAWLRQFEAENKVVLFP